MRSLFAWGAVVLGAFLGARPAAAITLTRGPYLQLLGTHSVTVVWKTDVPGDCGLTLRLPDGGTRAVAGPRSSTCAVPVGDLSPGTRYGYVPRADETALTAESTFHTDDPAAPFTFLVLGDSGCGCDGQRAVRDRMLATPADFILHTGDMIYPSGQSEAMDANFFRPYDPLLRRVVMWPSRGNHDVKTAGGEPWRDVFRTPANNAAGSEDYYSFDYGTAHVAVLDSNAATNPGSPQYVFLDGDLGSSNARWKFVVFHHSIYSSGTKHGSNIKIRRNLLPLLDRYHVDVVFMGHDHDYERTKPMRADKIVAPGEGTVYITTGGGGADVRPVEHSDFTAHVEAALHFVRVRVDGGTLRADMVTPDGAVHDSVTLTKSAAPG